MLRYVLSRLLVSAATVLLAILALFVLMRLVPGDPASVMLGPQASPALIASVRERMGLDLPLPVQFWRFLSAALTGDLGEDVFSRRPVLDIVLGQLPYTIALALAGLGWAMLLGMPLGCLSAMRPNSVLDRVVSVLSVATIAVPSFVVAVFALLLFSVTLRWFPAIGAGRAGDPLDQLSHLVLPAFAVGLGWVGYIARLLRVSMLEVLGEHHIRCARAFGLPEWRILWSYALPIAVLPLVTVLATGFGRLLSGAVFAEIVFTRPGLGYLVYSSIVARNYPVVLGGVLISTFLYVGCMLLADLLNAALNPRIREGLAG